MEPHIEALVELGLNYNEEPLESLSSQEVTHVRQVLRQYLKKLITKEKAIEELGEQTSDTIEKLSEIIDIPDEPIPNGNQVEDQISRQKSRPWSDYENKRLLAGILRFGLDSWSQIASFVGNGRTRSQCSQRWIRGLNPKISKSAWTIEEEVKLIDLVQTYGDKSWTKISSELGRRSDVQCRYRYQQMKRENTFPSSPQSSSSKHSSSYSSSGSQKKHKKHTKETKKTKKHSKQEIYRQQQYQLPQFPMVTGFPAMHISNPMTVFMDAQQLPSIFGVNIPSFAPMGIRTQPVFVPPVNENSIHIVHSNELHGNETNIFVEPKTDFQTDDASEEVPFEVKKTTESENITNFEPISENSSVSEFSQFQIIMPSIDPSWFAEV